MKVGKIPFNKIINGTKRIQSRIFDEKRQKLQIGDEIEFVQNDNYIRTKVIRLYKYNSFKDLFNEQIELFGLD